MMSYLNQQQVHPPFISGNFCWLLGFSGPGMLGTHKKNQSYSWLWWKLCCRWERQWRNSPHKQLFHPPSRGHWHSPAPKVLSVVWGKFGPTVCFFETDRQIYKFREPCLKYRMESCQSLELMAPCSRRDQSWSIGQSPWNGKPVTEEFWKYLLPKES